MVYRAIAHYRAADGAVQYVDQHLAGVARLTKLLAKKLGCELAGELIGLLHDYGKYSIEFFNYLKSAVNLLDPDLDDGAVDAQALKGKINHSTAGAQLIWQVLSERGPEAVVVGQVLALCIASHHSGLIDSVASDNAKGAYSHFCKRMLKSEKQVHLAEISGSADASVLARFHEIIEAPELTEGVLQLLTRIREHNRSLETRHQQYGLAVRMLFSCLIDADRIDSADFDLNRPPSVRPMGDYVPWPVLIQRLERHLASIPANPETRGIDEQRRAISESCLSAATRPEPGILTLTVPTGGGKTLASLRFALHHAAGRKLDRIIYIVPFTSIIDQNAAVARDVLEPEDAPSDRGRVVLEHHSNLMPEQQTWREKMLTENWDAPVVYTTLVQFLEALFGAGTRGARRMHQLANSVLIFDEIQSLPIRCVHLFNNAINFLAEQCNSTILFCTATQPLLHAVDAKHGAVRPSPDGELMPHVDDLFESLQRVRVRYGRKLRSNERIARLAVVRMKRTGSCLVVVNTKESARALYRQCREIIQEEGLSADAGGAEKLLFHLSTDMCPAHRADELGLRSSTKPANETIIGQLKLGLPTLCISTQLIEAGVDVDFGCVIRFLAGLDSIAQAAGRANRHGKQRTRDGRPAIADVFVVRPERENLNRLPEIRQGIEAARSVLGFYAADPARYAHNLLGPKAIHDYYKHYFFARAKDMTYPISREDEQQLGRKDNLLSLLSDNSKATMDLPEADKSMYFKQSFMTAARMFKAIDAPTEGILVPYGREGNELLDELLETYGPARQHELLRQAQRFTVSVYPWMLYQLEAVGVLGELHADSRVRYLTDYTYYSPWFGLTTEPEEDWRLSSMVVNT